MALTPIPSSRSDMPTYQYQTLPTDESPEVITFEIKQSMMDAALAVHPETGQPVRRIISGGFRPIGLRSRSPEVMATSCSHNGGPCCG
jgi:hypothetical protein